MRNIKTYALFLEIICWILVVPGVTIISCLRWYGRLVNLDRFNGFFGRVESVPFFSHLLIIFVELGSLILFLWGVFVFIKVLRGYRKGQLFTNESFSLFKRLSKIALGWAIYSPLANMFIVLLASFHRGPGRRVVELVVSSSDIFNIVIVGFFFVITSLLWEGCKLREEQDLTV